MARRRTNPSAPALMVVGVAAIGVIAAVLLVTAKPRQDPHP